MLFPWRLHCCSMEIPPKSVRVWTPYTPAAQRKSITLSPKPCQGKSAVMLARDHPTDSPASPFPSWTPVTRPLRHFYHWFSPEQELKACNEIWCLSEIPTQQMNQNAHFLTEAVDSISVFILSHCPLVLFCKGFAGRDANQEQTELGWVSSNKNMLSSKRGFFTPDTSPALQRGAPPAFAHRSPRRFPLSFHLPLLL